MSERAGPALSTTCGANSCRLVVRVGRTSFLLQASSAGRDLLVQLLLRDRAALDQRQPGGRPKAVYVTRIAVTAAAFRYEVCAVPLPPTAAQSSNSDFEAPGSIDRRSSESAVERLT